MPSHRRHFPMFPALVSLSGLLFCLWVMLSGGDALCLTNGCSLFQDFRLAGVSLWQVGVVLFALLLLSAILRAPRVGLILAGIALAADAILLAVMLFTAPCVNCLITGLFIVSAYLAFHRGLMPRRQTYRSPLLILWALLFLFDVGGVIRESAEPWTPVSNSGQPAVSIFFSPGCRACQSLTEQAERFIDARWIPVAEDERDIWLIHAMCESLAQGLPLQEAIRKAHTTVPGPADFNSAPGYRLGLLKPNMLLLQFRLWKNHAAALASGSDRLPLVQFMGLPSFLRGDAHSSHTGQQAPPSPPPLSEDRSTTPLSGIPEIDALGVAGFCGGQGSPSTCVDAAPSSGDLIDTSDMLR